MKALEIVKAMTRDADIAAAGGIALYYSDQEADDWAKEFFGAQWVCGSKPKEDKTYFYMYDGDIDSLSLHAFLRENMEDGRLVDNSGCRIFLWEIE